MKILVDADSTKRIPQLISIAKRYKIPIQLYSDYSRHFVSDYAEVIYSDISPESTDITLLNQCKKGDIVITNDIGLAGIALAKGAKVIHNSGRILTNQQIELDLTYRAMKQNMRRHVKHASQSRKVRLGLEHDPNCDFYKNLLQLIETSLDNA